MKRHISFPNDEKTAIRAKCSWVAVYVGCVSVRKRKSSTDNDCFWSCNLLGFPFLNICVATS
jgi:hypothetical protein